MKPSQCAIPTTRIRMRSHPPRVCVLRGAVAQYALEPNPPCTKADDVEPAPNLSQERAPIVRYRQPNWHHGSVHRSGAFGQILADTHIDRSCRLMNLSVRNRYLPLSIGLKLEGGVRDLQRNQVSFKSEVNERGSGDVCRVRPASWELDPQEVRLVSAIDDDPHRQSRMSGQESHPLG